MPTHSTMKRLHPIVLELLRQGPPHNQLLSKVTSYIALCGHLGAEPFQLPFNQLDHDLRLEGLSYQEGSGSSRPELDQMGEVMAELLGTVPGLAPALAQAQDEAIEMAHLRLVLTPHELALLPFECANVPKGAPGGAGAKLLLQTTLPVTMTREVRGVRPTSGPWKAKPRVLFAWAAPPEAGEVPYEEHLLALRRALKPWVELPREAQTSGRAPAPDEMVKQVQQRLTVVSRATLDDIYAACAASDFTHVHILAHGVPKELRHGQEVVGLALHDRSRRGVELVDGARLANALRASRTQEGAMPAVVTLATCDSGQVRSLVTHGGSIAHDLHVAGAMFVVASQFPLSKAGSVAFTDELYRRILDGQDPRAAMHHVRRRLYSFAERWHDWASLVAYANLPDDCDAHLAELNFRAAKRQIEALLEEADVLIARSCAPTARAGSSQGGTLPDVDGRLREVLDRLAEPKERLCAITGPTAESLGLQASTHKRKAEALYWRARAVLGSPSESGNGDPRYLLESLRDLEAARRLYRQAMMRNLSSHWSGTQYLALTLVLRAAGRLDDDAAFRDVWTAVKVAAEHALQLKAGHEPRALSDQAWAHASLAELQLLRSVGLDDGAKDEAAAAAKQHARQVVNLVSPTSFELYSTRRQLKRYVNWWSQPLDPRVPSNGCRLDAGPIATELIRCLEA